MNVEMDARSLNSSTAWQLWYCDTFDRDMPVSAQTGGADIIQGLRALWLYTLQEGVLDNGHASFSRFYLTWGDTGAARVDIAVDPFNNLALVKLKRWAGLMSQSGEAEDPQREAVLSRLAQVHYELLLKSDRWQASRVDWDAEARELLKRVDLITYLEDL